MNWYRGQLHAHSYWSDGRGFPEQAIAAYRKCGYHFLCLSEHNRFADNPAEWRQVHQDEGPWPPQISQSIFENLRREFGTAAAEIRLEQGAQFVRLRTFEELKCLADCAEEFLLLPGMEITRKVRDLGVHMNYLNLPAVVPSASAAGLIQDVSHFRSAADLIAANCREVQAMASAMDRPCLVSVNHPFWQFCDVQPQDLIACPEVRFFEVCNGGALWPPDAGAPNYTCESFWDAVNAFRCMRGEPLLLGIASDDAHYYDEGRRGGADGVNHGFVEVWAQKLAARELLAAMQEGDFYASNGVRLENVAFDPADKSLRVKVRGEPGVRYRIVFVSTKREFDQRVTFYDSPARGKRPARRIPIYSSEIGSVKSVFEGDEAVCCMDDDDLYIRARIESDVAAPVCSQRFFYPQLKSAWTQPFARSAG